MRDSKKFIKIVFGLSIVVISTMTQIIYYTTTHNSLYELSQKRINEVKNSNAEIVFIGDSSLGAGLDEKYFEKLSGKTTINLSTTAGAHNLSGSYNMIRHTIKNNKDVKLIVIMQTPFVWYKDFAIGGYCSTLNDLDFGKEIDLKLIEKLDCIKFKYLNLASISEYIQMKKANEAHNNEVKTYKNDGRNIVVEVRNGLHSKINNIGKTKIDEIKLIDEYVKNKNIKVVFIQGSLHEEIAKKYNSIIVEQQRILKSMENIIFVEEYLYPKNENMGDTENHVDISYKKESTYFYFEALKKFIP